MSTKKNKHSDEKIIEIIESFNGKIKQSLTHTSYQDRDDLEQEIKLKIIEKLNTVEFREAPSFWNFLT